MITQTLLNQIFCYENGELFWKISPAKQIKIGSKAGNLKPNGYFRVGIGHKSYAIHRLIFMMHHGYMPTEIDHIDNNPSNNCIENLREANRFQNTQNAIKRKDCSSRVKGVCWKKSHKKWVVQLQVNGKRKSFGYYNDIEYAKFVADAMRYKYHKEFSKS